MNLELNWPTKMLLIIYPNFFLQYILVVCWI